MASYHSPYTQAAIDAIRRVNISPILSVEQRLEDLKSISIELEVLQELLNGEIDE